MEAQSTASSISLLRLPQSCPFSLSSFFSVPTQLPNMSWSPNIPPKWVMFTLSKGRSVVSDSLWHHGLRRVRLLSPWNSPGQNTRVGSLSLLKGIFPTLGLNPGLLHCRQTLYQLSHLGSPISPPRYPIVQSYFFPLCTC